MRPSKVAVLFLILVSAGCGTMRHQTSADSPHATLELNEYIPIYVVAIWCDQRRLPADSRRVYRIAVGEHEMKTELERRQVIRTPSGDEEVAVGLAGLALGAAAAFAFNQREPAPETAGRVPNPEEATERYTQVTSFTAAAGQAYVFDGYLVRLKEEP